MGKGHLCLGKRDAYNLGKQLLKKLNEDGISNRQMKGSTDL